MSNAVEINLKIHRVGRQIDVYGSNDGRRASDLRPGNSCRYSAHRVRQSTTTR
jgi:hypothetical protein